MTRNSTRSYWMSDKSWYEIVDGKPQLTSLAPPAAQRSFAEWNMKPRKKTASKYLRVLRAKLNI